MTHIDAIDALKYGVTGFGLVLALLSYRLLRKEQGRKDLEKERPKLVGAIKSFMIFAVVLCAIGLLSELFIPQSCADAVSALNRSNEVLSNLERTQNGTISALQNQEIGQLASAPHYYGDNQNAYEGLIRVASMTQAQINGMENDFMNKIGSAIDAVNKTQLACAPALGTRR